MQQIQSLSKTAITKQNLHLHFKFLQLKILTSKIFS